MTIWNLATVIWNWATVIWNRAMVIWNRAMVIWNWAIVIWNWARVIWNQRMFIWNRSLRYLKMRYSFKNSNLLNLSNYAQEKWWNHWFTNWLTCMNISIGSPDFGVVIVMIHNAFNSHQESYPLQISKTQSQCQILANICQEVERKKFYMFVKRHLSFFVGMKSVVTSPHPFH